MSTTEFTTPNPELAPLYAKLPPVYKTTAENIVEGRERMRKFIMPLLHSREAPYLPAGAHADSRSRISRRLIVRKFRDDVQGHRHDGPI